MSEQQVAQFQDVGEFRQKIRLLDEVGPSGVEPLIPDDNESHAEALREIRESIDSHYGDSIERLAGEDEEVVVERVVIPSDDLPYMEYTVVEERKDE